MCVLFHLFNAREPLISINTLNILQFTITFNFAVKICEIIFIAVADYNIILVLVHFKRKFILKDHPLSHDEHLLEDKRHIRLRDKKRIVHFAFHSDDKGLYKHEENKKGMERLVQFIKGTSK